MTQHVSDIRGNAPEAIVHAAESIGRSKHRLAVFIAIYTGKQKVKSIDEVSIALSDIKNLATRTKTALDRARDLASDDIIKAFKDTKTGKMGYEKVPFYSKHRNKILKLVESPGKIKNISTKRNNQGTRSITLIVDKKKYIPEFVTIDDINNFAKVKQVSSCHISVPVLAEERLKKLFADIIGEKGEFKDWGGEKNDLYTTQTKVMGKRVRCAIAFKGKATKGKLTPKKLGAQADQISRLFKSEATLFLVVYQGQIDQSVVEQMKAFAYIKSLENNHSVMYGVVDAEDVCRIIESYPEQTKDI